MLDRKIVFLVLPQVHLLDLAGPVQAFQEARDNGAHIHLGFCAAEERLASSCDFPLGRLMHYQDMRLSSGDYLFIAGAQLSYLLSRDAAADKALHQWLRACYSQGVNLCSVCTGAFFLAATGLLAEHICTTHWKHTAELKRRYPAANVVSDVLFTEDEGIYTSAGVAAGIDLALHIVGKLCGEEMAFKVARELVVYLRRGGNSSQQSVHLKYRNHIHTGVHAVQDYVQENISKKVSLEQLADIVCMSPRNMTRTFKKETGITVNEYTTLIRKELLRNLSQNPDISRKQMARLCGLSSERQVIRLLKAASVH